MKKINFKVLGIILVLCYTHYAAYKQFRHVGNDLQNLMEWVGFAGEEAGQLAKGAIK